MAADNIAAATDVVRMTVFNHSPREADMLFDHDEMQRKRKPSFTLIIDEGTISLSQRQAPLLSQHLIVYPSADEADELGASVIDAVSIGHTFF